MESEFGYTKSLRLARTSSMKDKPNPADSSLSETMAARIEIAELGDPAHQKKIIDAVEALDGVIETKIERARCTSRTIRWQRPKRKSSTLSTPLGAPLRLRPLTRKARIQIHRHEYLLATAET
jgi:hypothetical protein